MDSDAIDEHTPPVVMPVVFGYIRSESADEDQIEAWDRQIADFCDDAYLLASVYCDRHSDGLELTRPGFAGLLDALAMPLVVAAVMPDLSHLSPDTTVREALSQQVRRAGARILVTRHTNGTADDAATTGSASTDIDNGGELP